MGERNAASTTAGTVSFGRERRRRRTDRHAFLLVLADVLRPMADPDEAQSIACRLLGQELHASRVGYAEDGGDGETIAVTRNYCDGVPGLEGTYRYDDYDPDLSRRSWPGKPSCDPTSRMTTHCLRLREPHTRHSRLARLSTYPS